MTDDELMEAVQSGDEDAFATLVSRHQPRLVGFFHKQLRDWQTAEDLSQDVLTKVYLVAGRYQSNENFLGLLYSIARNVLVDWTRRNRELTTRKPHTERESCFLYSIPGDEHNPLDHAAVRDLENRVYGFLERVPEDQRFAFILIVYCGLTFSEVAASMESTLSTAKSRYRLACEKVREMLIDRGNLEPEQVAIIRERQASHYSRQLEGVA